MQKIPDWQRSLWTSMRDRNYPVMVLRETLSVKLPFAMNWEQLAVWTSSSLEDLMQLNKKLINIEYLKEGTWAVVPGKALNVSYSEDGLKWTTNKFAKSLYYENAYLFQTDKGPQFKGNMKRKANVMVSAFIPKDHILGSRMNHDAQKAEYLWCNKALHLLYGGEKEGGAKDTISTEEIRLD